jgi:hypothetical protein
MFLYVLRSIIYGHNRMVVILENDTGNVNRGIAQVKKLH